MLTLTHSTYD